MVSNMSRAGWAGGMLSASKLYQSDSASGPSATVKPMPTKTSSNSARAWETRCRWPRAGEREDLGGDHFGQVKAVGAQRCGALGLGQLGPSRGQGGLQLRLHFVDPLTGLLAGRGIEPPEAAVRTGQRGALAEVLRLDLGQGVGRGRARDGPLAVAGDHLDIELHVLSHHVMSFRYPRCYVPRDRHPGVGGTPRSRRPRRPRPR